MAIGGLNCTPPSPPPPVPPPPVLPPPTPPSSPQIMLTALDGESISGTSISASGPLNLQASLVGATSIEFYVDNVWVKRDETAPFTLYNTPTSLSAGQHKLVVIAYTGTYPSLSVVGYREYSLTVSNPQSGQLTGYGSIALSGSSATTTGSFSIKYTPLASPSSVEWSVNSVKYRTEYLAPYYLFGDDATTGFVNTTQFVSYPTIVCVDAFLGTNKIDNKCVTVTR